MVKADVLPQNLATLHDTRQRRGQYTMDRELQLLLLGGMIGFVGAILGGVAEAGFGYVFGDLRYRREERRRWLRTALEWAAVGRKESLRRADLRGWTCEG